MHFFKVTYIKKTLEKDGNTKETVLGHKHVRGSKRLSKDQLAFLRANEKEIQANVLVLEDL